MQIIQAQGNTIEKVIRDKDGQLIRARFFVYENNGRIKARLLDFVYLAEQALLNGANFILSGFAKVKATLSKSFSISHYSEPKLAFVSIYSSGSKPRAPTF